MNFVQRLRFEMSTHGPLQKGRKSHTRCHMLSRLPTEVYRGKLTTTTNNNDNNNGNNTINDSNSNSNSSSNSTTTTTTNTSANINMWETAASCADAVRKPFGVSAILYYTILYYTILYYTILYYTILYYTILYYTILYYNITFKPSLSLYIHIYIYIYSIVAKPNHKLLLSQNQFISGFLRVGFLDKRKSGFLPIAKPIHKFFDN